LREEEKTRAWDSEFLRLRIEHFCCDGTVIGKQASDATSRDGGKKALKKKEKGSLFKAELRLRASIPLRRGKESQVLWYVNQTEEREVTYL